MLAGEVIMCGLVCRDFTERQMSRHKDTADESYLTTSQVERARVSFLLFHSERIFDSGILYRGERERVEVKQTGQ